MNLLLAESRRLAHRRAIWVVAGGLILVQLALMGTIQPYSMNYALESSIGMGVGFGVVVAILSCASYVGAEHSTNSLSTLLTFVPRRERVYLAKMATAAGWSALVGLVYIVLPLFFSLAWLTTTRSGYYDRHIDLSAGIWLGRFVLGLLVVVGAGTASAALAFITRGATAVIGVTAGYLVVVEGLVQTLIGAARPYLLINNLVAFVAGENSVGYQSCDRYNYCQWVDQMISWPQAAIILGVIWLALAVGGLVALQRRDID